MKVLPWESEAKTKGADRSGRRSVFDYGGAERRLRTRPPFQSESFEAPRLVSRSANGACANKIHACPGILWLLRPPLFRENHHPSANLSPLLRCLIKGTLIQLKDIDFFFCLHFLEVYAFENARVKGFA